MAKASPAAPASIPLLLLIGAVDTAAQETAAQVPLGEGALKIPPGITLLEGCWQFFLFSTTLLFLIIVHSSVFVLPARPKPAGPVVPLHC